LALAILAKSIIYNVKNNGLFDDCKEELALV